MKTLRAWICPFAALTFSAMAHAAPVQYQVTAIHLTEIIWDGSQVIADEDDDLFEYGTTLYTTFSYDSTTPATSTNNPWTSEDFGAYSYYTGSVTNFSGNILGHSFNASSGDTRVHDSYHSDPSSAIFNLIGRQNRVDSPSRNSFEGFSISNFTLVGGYVMSIDPSSTSQSLPDSLLGNPALVQLDFKNSAGTYHFAVFIGNITPVPLPSSALFFLSGLIGLSVNALRKLKR